MANERQLTLHSPVLSGDQALMVRRIEGREGLSQLFHYDVTLYARSEDVDFSKVLGHEMCVGLELPGGKERYFHGYVASFADVASAGEYTVYRAELRPHLWRLTRATNSRIYQGETVPNIVEGILKHYGLDIDAHYGGGNRGDYLPWEYCVQYRETDFAFVSRLLEYEGIHYFFRHEKQRHVLVLADGNVHHEPVAGYAKVEYTRAPNQPNRRQECIWEWRVASSVLPDKVSATDFDFREPAKALAGGSGSEVKREHGKVAEYEVYDHLETVVQQEGYAADMTADYARIRSEELHVRFAVASAHTDARGLCAGAALKLDQGPASTQKKDYIILRTELSAEMDAYGTTAATSGSGAVVYRCWFEAFDKTHPYRPPRITPKPVIPGPQSAIVAGQGGPIVTDRWGRVYVKFHWARAPETNERELSCWLRVSQNSAGNQWGSMFVPHVGQEVLVGFLEGDPDRPIVIGRVYNGANPPPLTLPAEAHNSIIRDVGGNQIIMDPTKGKEKITITSPKNHSAVQLGNEGIRLFSRKRGGTYTWDTETYAFGHKISYTKGWSWSVDRGFWGAIKAGAGVSVTVGADYKFSMGPRMDVKVGPVMTIQHERSVSVGRSFELKTTAGAYRRMSGSNAVLDSKKSVFIAGNNDNAMLTAAEKELTLSFDDSDSNRQAEMEKAEKAVVRQTGAALAIASTAAVVGGVWYQKDVADMGPVHQKTGDESTEELEAEYSRISAVSASDAMPVISAFMGVKLVKPDEPKPPEHKGPSAKIKLAKDVIEVFVGDAKKTNFSLKKASGFEFKSDKSIVASSDQGIKLEGKQGILMKANSVNVDAAFKHRYFEILP